MASVEQLLSLKSKRGADYSDEEEEDDRVNAHPNFSASDEEDDLEDEGRHSKLLQAISSMDTKKKSKVKQRSEPSAEVSEFQLNTKDAQGKGVWIHDLMGSLKNTPSHSALKKQMNTINKRKVLPTPLHQHEAEKIQRKMAYNTVSKEVSKWDQVVHANRRAETQTFPLNQEVLGLPTTGQFVQKFKPSTPLEQEVYKILHGSKFAERPNKKLTQAEEEAMKAMSLSEARERRAELQKHRALMSFFEAKCRRQKKIKSKKYHRIQRKSKARQETKRMEELMKTDPEAAQESMDQMEKSRALERMSLKHRNTGKWAKTMIRYGKNNISARQEIADQLQKSHELTEKIAKVTEDDESKDDEADDEEDAVVQPSLSDINNPWFTGGKAGKKGGEEQEEEEEDEERKKSGLIPLEAVKVSKVDDGDDEEQDDEEEEGDDELAEDHKMLKMIQGERRKWQGGDDDDDDDEEEEEEEEEDKAPSSKQKKGKTTGKDKRTKKNKAKKIKVIEVEEKDEADNDDELLEEGLERRQTHKLLEDQEWLNRLEEESGTAEQQQPPDVIRIESGHEDVASATPSSANVDPSKVFTVKPKEMNSLAPKLVEDGEEESDGRREQRMNIQQAFADDDVVDEFREEKKAKVEKDKPKDIDLTLPGWGDWGGMGVQQSKKKRKRFVRKAPPQAPRRDASLPNVIINENRDKNIAIHQVSNLPFPFSSSQQFERSIRAPVGSTWNTPSAVKALTTPRVSTKMGTIIPPIKAEEAFKGKGRKPRHSEQQTTTKRKGPRPDIVFGEDGGGDKKRNNNNNNKRRRKGKGKGK